MRMRMYKYDKYEQVAHSIVSLFVHACPQVYLCMHVHVSPVRASACNCEFTCLSWAACVSAG